MTTTRQKLLNLLAFVQNAPQNIHADIMTFTAFMDEAEIAKHLAHYGRRMDSDRQAELLGKLHDLQAQAA